MSLLTCLKLGTTIGFAGGLISSAYLRGAQRTHDIPAGLGTQILSFAPIVSGPLVGAGAGTAYYGLNKWVRHLQGAPRSTQFVFLAVMSSLVAMKGAYALGKAE